MLRWDTGGGLLGIMVLGVAGIYAIARLPALFELIGGVIWWSFGQ